jgi:hypothetical protein
MKRNIDLLVRKFIRRRGRKPQIVPMEKKFFLYHTGGQGFIITEDSLLDLIHKYAKREKADRSKIDEILLDLILAQQKKKTEEKEEFDQIDKKQLCALIQETCENHTYQEMLQTLEKKLDQAYGSRMGKSIFEGIQEYFNTVMVVSAMAKEKKKNRIVLPIKCRQPEKIKEVRVKWDFSKNHHEKFCEAQGFTKEEYQTMIEYLPLEKIREMRQEAISEQGGTYVNWVPVPHEVLFFIKSLYAKKLINIEGRRTEKNQILEKGHNMAKIQVVCKNQRGREYTFHYEAKFQMYSTNNVKYGYREEVCRFHFSKV